MTERLTDKPDYGKGYLNLSSIDFMEVEVFMVQLPSLSVISMTGVEADEA